MVKCKLNPMPEVPKVSKKLREARFFLGQMEQLGRSTASTRLDHDHFEFYLSAFLSAARSITDYFERDRKYRVWYRDWKMSQPEEDRQLINQMTNQRDLEVHEEGANIAHELEDVPLSKIDMSGLHAAYAHSFGEPWGEPQVSQKVYYFVLEGRNVNAIETCNRYADLLIQAVDEFTTA